MQKRKNELKKEMNLVNRYFDKKNISMDVRDLVRNFLEFKFKKEDEVTLEEEVYILNNLPNKLRLKV
jgi:hypothetical protein